MALLKRFSRHCRYRCGSPNNGICGSVVTGFSKSKRMFLLRAICVTVSSAFSTTLRRSNGIASAVIERASSLDQSKTAVTILCLREKESPIDQTGSPRVRHDTYKSSELCRITFRFSRWESERSVDASITEQSPAIANKGVRISCETPLIKVDRECNACCNCCVRISTADSKVAYA